MSEYAKGYVPRDYDREPLGTFGFMAPFNVEPIPRSEWPAMIRDKERQKNRLSDIVKQTGTFISDQNGYGYCWAHGTVAGMRVAYAVAGYGNVPLSATALAAQVKNFRDQGGNTPEAIRHATQYGVPTLDTWPENRVDRSLVTPDMQDEATRYKMTEWYELEPNNFDQMATCLLMNIPVTCGFMWWGHMVCAIDLVAPDEILIMNSWGTRWGDQGFGTLKARKAVAFDQAACRVVTPLETA